LKAREQVRLTDQVSGLVQAIRFTEGERVEQGQVLVELDDDQEQAKLAEAIAIRYEAHRQYRRGLELQDSGLITPAQLDELEAASKTAKANVEVAEAQLRDLTIKTPFSGLIGLRQVSPGALLTPGTIIAELNIVDPLDLSFGVRSDFLPQLKPGLTVLARAKGFTGRVFRGRLRRIDTTIDPQTRKVQVEAELPSPDGILKPGLFMTVELVLETRPDALIIPEEALLLRGQDQYVYVVQDNNRIKRIAVETGQRQRGEVEIRQGLQAGATVVVGGIQKIQAGQPVKPLQADQDDKGGQLSPEPGG
jgi:membrane fusion protein, multidrug efflux system